MLIDMLEGQLITLFIVVAFILTFLIREWVVQQQPGLNMAAAAADDVAQRQAGNVPAIQQLARQHAEQQLPGTEAQDVPAENDSEEIAQPEAGERQRMVARPQQRRGQESPLQDAESQGNPSLGLENAYSVNTPEDPSSAGVIMENPAMANADAQAGQQRPGMPTRDIIRRAAELRQALDEQSRAFGQQDWPGLKIFMDLWDRAERKPSQVLEIIDEEGRTDELGWIVAAMRRLESKPPRAADAKLEPIIGENPSIEDHEEGESDERQSINQGVLPGEIRRSVDGFWPSIDFEETSFRDENESRSRLSPRLSAADKVAESSCDNERSSLRDISNQQFDGSSPRPSSSQAPHAEHGDSDSDFVLVQEEKRADTPYPSPPSRRYHRTPGYG